MTDGRWGVVCESARRRAKQSSDPKKFIDEFEDELQLLRKYKWAREFELLEERRPWVVDELQVAAQVEALSAYRALEHWGTSWGLCPGSYQLSQAQLYRKYREAA